MLTYADICIQMLIIIFDELRLRMHSGPDPDGIWHSRVLVDYCGGQL